MLERMDRLNYEVIFSTHCWEGVAVPEVVFVFKRNLHKRIPKYTKKFYQQSFQRHQLYQKVSVRVAVFFTDVWSSMRYLNHRHPLMYLLTKYKTTWTRSTFADKKILRWRWTKSPYYLDFEAHTVLWYCEYLMW